MQATIADILTKLPEWEKENLNEAQTCQVIILRILAKLNYDIWNPFEVSAQLNSGGGLGGYIPDYTINLCRQDCFIIEAKALTKEFTDNDRTQTVNYVNAKNLRWAVLTNGKKWLFFDNKLDGEASKRVALELDLRNDQVTDYLTQLLVKEEWLVDKPNERITENVQLIKIKMQLYEVVKERAYSFNEKGLSKMIAFELKSEEEKRLAQVRFKELEQWFLSVENRIKDGLISPVIPSVVTAVKIPLEISTVIPLLKEKLQQIVEDSGRQPKMTVKFDDFQIPVVSWLDIYIGVAETCLQLKKENSIQFVKESEMNLKLRYKRLSNGLYVFTNWSAQESRKQISRLLQALQISDEFIEVIYNSESYWLPVKKI